MSEFYFAKRATELNNLFTKSKIEKPQKDIPQGMIDLVGKLRSQHDRLNTIERREFYYQNEIEDISKLQDLKKEIYAHGTWLLENSWKKIYAWKKDEKNNTKLGIYVPDEFDMDIVPPHEFTSLPLEERIDMVFHAMRATFIGLIMQLLEHYEMSSRISPEDKKTYENYKKIMFLPNVVKGEDTIRQHLFMGVNTATSVTWGLIKILPEVYKKQYGTYPTTEMYKQLINDTLPLMSQLSRMHVAVFSIIQTVILNPSDVNVLSILQRRTTNPLDQSYYRYLPARFFFEESENRKILSVKADVMEKVVHTLTHADVNTKEPWLGCPAWTAKGVEKANVVIEMFDWALALANEYILPAYKEQLQKENL